MPFSLSKKLELGEMRPTTISLQLVDHFVKYHLGVLEMTMGVLCVLVDLVILEMEEDMRTPLILRRPFLPLLSAILI